MSTATVKKNIRQPKGTTLFYLTTFFERSAYYLVAGLLALYIVLAFHETNSFAYQLAGNFLILSFICPLVGGWVADRYLANRNTVLIGAFLECIGFLILLFPGYMSLYIALSVISTGSGLFKGNIINMYGCLYSERDDNRKAAGYTLYYVVFNIGVVLTDFLSGYIVKYLGWQVAFIFAVLGMLISFSVFYYGLKLFNPKADFSNTEFSAANLIRSFLVIALMIIVGFFFLYFEAVAIAGFILASVICIWLFMHCIKKDYQNRKKYIAYFLFILVSIFFWAVYWQTAISLPLFIKDVVRKDIMGFYIPAATFSTFSDLGVVVLGFCIALLWSFLSGRGYVVTAPVKFFLGMLMATLVFVILLISSASANDYISPYWIIAAYFILSLGELLISPTSLSLAGTLIPKQSMNLMMGVYFLAIGIGAKLGELMDVFVNVPKVYGYDIKKLVFIYHCGYYVYLMLGLLGMTLALMLIPVLKKLMRDNA